MSTDALAAAPIAPAEKPAEQLVCAQCKAALPTTEFGPRERERLRKDQIGRCHACSNKNKFLTTRGIKRSDYDDLLVAQKQCCGRCEKPLKTSTPHVGIWPGGDKKHSRMHGIVCSQCQNAITSHSTSVEQCMITANYLMKTRAPPTAAERAELESLIAKFNALLLQVSK